MGSEQIAHVLGLSQRGQPRISHLASELALGNPVQSRLGRIRLSSHSRRYRLTVFPLPRTTEVFNVRVCDPSQPNPDRIDHTVGPSCRVSSNRLCRLRSRDPRSPNSRDSWHLMNRSTSMTLRDLKTRRAVSGTSSSRIQASLDAAPVYFVPRYVAFPGHVRPSV